MKFTERAEFLYDPELFKARDAQVLLRLTDEAYRKMGARRPAKFFEVDRSPDKIDPLWHMPTSPRTQFSRELEIPAINQFQKPKLTELLKLGQSYQRRDTFWIANLALQRADWWPLRGDMAYWNGLRYQILHVDVPPESYFGQTGLWTAVTLECVVPAGGDALPAGPVDALQPGERGRGVPAVQP